jgi:hypothetical protein
VEIQWSTNSTGTIRSSRQIEPVAAEDAGDGIGAFHGGEHFLNRALPIRSFW